MACRRCTVCEGMTHHWLEGCEDSADPTYTHGCKHCLAVGFACDWCDGSGLAEEEDGETLCNLCHGEGVLYVCDIAMCALCDTRLDSAAPTDSEQFCAECRSTSSA
jgi:hypothetical protein